MSKREKTNYVRMFYCIVLLKILKIFFYNLHSNQSNLVADLFHKYLYVGFQLTMLGPRGHHGAHVV
jgi:hypothetical protein